MSNLQKYIDDINPDIKNKIDTIMEEQSKYYTPEIEEFHIGFRYLDEGGSQVCDGDDLCGYILDDYEHKPDDFYYRVKYLDRDDIEELGWSLTTYQHKGETRYYMMYDESMYYLILFKGNKISIEYQDRDVLEAELDLFNGVCKNYSQLKTIMTQVGIL